jgi:hypothetical protein
MKSIISLRVLSLLGFLLLMAPFYDHCSWRKTEEAPVEAPAIEETEVEIDTISTEKGVYKKDTVNYPIAEEISFYQKAYEFIDDEDSENAFEMAKMGGDFFLNFNFKEFKAELIKDIRKEHCKGIAFLLKNICFVFIILLSFLMLLFSFTKKWRLIYMYSIINLILLLITIVCIVFFDGFFKDINQIKWGYYVFSIVQILIFIFSKKLSNRVP